MLSRIFWHLKCDLIEPINQPGDDNECIQYGVAMIVYKVFCKNYDLKKGELMGMLIERRKDLRGKTPVESGLRWAKLAFSHMVKDRKAILVVPNELKLRNDTQWLRGKGVLTKEELPGMVKLIEQARKRVVSSVPE
jgi:hypothetical protein